jgi:hypothetical protein
MRSNVRLSSGFGYTIGDDRCALRCRFEHLVVSVRVMQRPRHVAAQQLLLDAHHQRTRYIPLLIHCLKLRAMQLLIEPQLPEGIRVCHELVALPSGLHGVERGVGGQHPALDGRVRAREPRHIQVALLRLSSSGEVDRSRAGDASKHAAPRLPFMSVLNRSAAFYRARK